MQCCTGVSSGAVQSEDGKGKRGRKASKQKKPKKGDPSVPTEEVSHRKDDFNAMYMKVKKIGENGEIQE